MTLDCFQVESVCFSGYLPKVSLSSVWRTTSFMKHFYYQPLHGLSHSGDYRNDSLYWRPSSGTWRRVWEWWQQYATYLCSLKKSKARFRYLSWPTWTTCWWPVRHCFKNKILKLTCSFDTNHKKRQSVRSAGVLIEPNPHGRRLMHKTRTWKN